MSPATMDVQNLPACTAGIRIRVNRMFSARQKSRKTEKLLDSKHGLPASLSSHIFIAKVICAWHYVGNYITPPATRLSFNTFPYLHPQVRVFKSGVYPHTDERFFFSVELTVRFDVFSPRNWQCNNINLTTGMVAIFLSISRCREQMSFPPPKSKDAFMRCNLRFTCKKRDLKLDRSDCNLRILFTLLWPQVANGAVGMQA